MQSNRKTCKVFIVSLGCSKNLVDAECMTRILLDDSMEMVADPSAADVIIVNTCGFIESAKKEAIDTILEMIDYKKPNGNCDYVVVTGCLAQRYAEDIRNDIPEVDQIIGTAHYNDIANAIHLLYGEYEGTPLDFVSEPGSLLHMRTNRILSTKNYAWLKIAEGCSNRCSYCAIPFIRGPYISRNMKEIITEAAFLSDSGASEIILTAQDTTRYGVDIYGKRMLPELLRELSKLTKIRLIRIMYSYSDGITDELIQEISNNPKVAHYLDMPVQHGDDIILKNMKRHDTSASISDTLTRLRSKIPDIILRTTVLVGFPGESKEAFDNLISQIKIWRFDRLGCFVFSPEEGTEAFDMRGHVRKDIALKRYNRVLTVQQEISQSKNMERLQSITDVTIETFSDDGIFYVGRSYGEAPEVDPCIYVAAACEPLDIGRSYPVRIVDCSAYDLTGVTEL